MMTVRMMMMEREMMCCVIMWYVWIMSSHKWQGMWLVFSNIIERCVFI